MPHGTRSQGSATAESRRRYLLAAPGSSIGRSRSSSTVSPSNSRHSRAVGWSLSNRNGSQRNLAEPSGSSSSTGGRTQMNSSPPRRRRASRLRVTVSSPLVFDRHTASQESSTPVSSSRTRRRDEETVDAGVGGSEGAESVEGEDLTMRRMLKRLKTLCPEELSKLSKAAAEMEKAKIEDKRKVDEFVAKTPDLATLIDDCYICMEPLLNNIGTTKFGVMSWQCRCTVAQKAHASCLFSKMCRSSKCDMCNSPILFDSPRANRDFAKVRFVNSKPPRMPSILSPVPRSDIGDHRHDQDAASEASTVTDDGEGRGRIPLASLSSDTDMSVRRSFSATDDRDHHNHNHDDDQDDNQDNGLEDDQYDAAEHDDHGEDDDHGGDDDHAEDDDREEDDHVQDDQNEEFDEDEGGDFAPAVHADEGAYAEEDERQRLYVNPYVVNSEVQLRRGTRSRSRMRRVNDNEDEMAYI